MGSLKDDRFLDPEFLAQVQLQNILMSKHVEHFLVQVSSWQKKLMVADQVISIWMGLQRTWAHLQSIFTNSEDIRNQLAQDAQRFEGIHLDFQVPHSSASAGVGKCLLAALFRSWMLLRQSVERHEQLQPKRISFLEIFILSFRIYHKIIIIIVLHSIIEWVSM